MGRKGKNGKVPDRLYSLKGNFPSKDPIVWAKNTLERITIMYLLFLGKEAHINQSYFFTAQNGRVWVLFLGEVLPLAVKGAGVCSSSSSEDESPSYATNGINAGCSSSFLAFFDEDGDVSAVVGKPCFLVVPKDVPNREGSKDNNGKKQRIGIIIEWNESASWSVPSQQGSHMKKKRKRL